MPLLFTDLLQSIAARFDRSASTPAPPLPTTAAKGAYGERVAAAYLRPRGFHLLYRNYLTERGEIDLICREGKFLVFVEVRTRGSLDFGRPIETIDSDKKAALKFAAQHYLALLDSTDIFHRFDAVEVMLTPGAIPQCHLIRDIFA